MSMSDVLKDSSTEPEAAHLRNVLRRVQVVIASGSSVQLAPALASSIDAICKEALDRPRTNGDVIDALVKENGDLRSANLRLEERLRTVQHDAVATHERLRNQIEVLKDEIVDLEARS